MITLAIANVCIGVGLLLIGLPLAFRKVPMNYAYGIRTKAAFESAESWYEINAQYGRRFAKLGAPMLVIGVIGFFIPSTFLVSYTVTSCVLPLLALILPIERLFQASQPSPPKAKDSNPSRGPVHHSRQAPYFAVIGLIALAIIPNVLFWSDISQFGNTLLPLFLIGQIAPLSVVTYIIVRQFKKTGRN